MSTPLEKVSQAGDLLIDAVNQIGEKLTQPERVAFRNALKVVNDLSDLIERRRLQVVNGSTKP